MLVLYTLVWPWAVALVISIFFAFAKNWQVGLEVFSVSLLALLAEPLIAFSVYFCGMHSFRHLLRTQLYVKLPTSRLLGICMLPMLGVSVFVALGWLYLPESRLDAKVMQFLFVMLGALTVPHMLLVDRVRHLT